MISPTDLAVVILAVSIVLTFVLTMRRFLQRAHQDEATEDDPPLGGSDCCQSSRF